MAYKQKQNRPTHVLIDTEAFAHNLDLTRKLCGDTPVMAVIKADGYGHGMEVSAQSLNGADEFGVNSLDDVHRLRKAGINKRLNLLSPSVDLDSLNKLSELNVRTMFYDLAQLKQFEKLEPTANLDIWLKVDTGMGRLGVAPDELGFALNRLKDIEGISRIGLMTHLANADSSGHPKNKQQIKDINDLSVLHNIEELSILNSAGVVNYSEAAESIVRPGLILYGISPTPRFSRHDLGLRAVMTFRSELISVKRLPAGSSIGYGSTYTLDMDSRIGIVACGYGDGYPRHARSGTPVLINDSLVPLIGRVSMDMIAVDLGQMDAAIGDVAVLWGEGNPIEDVAAFSGTIAYELSCGILPRVERIII